MVSSQRSKIVYQYNQDHILKGCTADPRLCNTRNSPIVKVVFPLPDVAAPMSNCGFIL